MSRLPHSILLARFRVRPEALRGRGVSLLDFVWKQPLQDFLNRYSLQDLLEQQSYQDRLPYRRLNSAILVQSPPPIVYAFEAFSSPEQRERENQLDQRCMLSLETSELLLPSPHELQRMVVIWGQQWFQRTFQKHGLGDLVRQLELTRTLGNMLHEYEPAWYQRELYDLWREQKDDRRYKAIPSLFAAFLHNKESVIHGIPVVWRLAQDRATHQLVVVSNPLPFEYVVTDQEKRPHLVQGIFAYKIRFALHTFAGTSEQQVHMFLSCIRYMDRTITTIPWKKEISVFMSTAKARREEWPISQTLVSLPIITYGNIREAHWSDDLSQLLEQLEIRSLADPRSILENPVLYSTPSAQTNWDQFLIPFATGIKPRHRLKMGIGCQERMDIEKSILGYLEEMIIPSAPLQRDKATMMVKKTMPLMALDDLRHHCSPERLSSVIEQALKQAFQGKQLTLLICWYTPRTLEAIKKELRKLLCLTDNDPWPEWLIILEYPVSDELVGPLESGHLDPESFYDKARPKNFFEQWKRQMGASRAHRLKVWDQQVWSQFAVEPGNYKLALIEIPQPEERIHPSQFSKGTLRLAASSGWHAANQMINPMKPRYDENHLPLEENKQESQGRVKNALADLLLRQSGVLFDVPAAIYEQQAKLPSEIAANLVVIGLFRKRTKRTRDHPKVIDLPLAIRLLPYGTVEMCLPEIYGKKGRWLPYLDATITELGPRFAAYEGVAYSPVEIITFLREVVQEANDRPTLILAVASDWRSRIWPQLQNDRLHDPHTLDMNSEGIEELISFPLITPKTHPNLRVIRLRKKGSSGETPQYITTIDPVSWNQGKEATELRSAFGCVDIQIPGPFLHYLSIGKQSKMARKQNGKAYKQHEGGNIAFKYPTILEIVPIFLQERDEPLLWARIPHFLRESPGWDGGGLLLPYPIHLAEAAVEDYMVLFGEAVFEAEEDE